MSKKPVERLAYSIREAAQVVGVSERLFAERVRCGEVPSFRIGRRRLIGRDALHHFMNGRRAKAERNAVR